MKFISTNVNLEIQKNLTEMFQNYINYEQVIRKFKMEDIDNHLLFAQEEARIELEKIKKILIKNNKLEKIQNLFEQSPILSDSFHAAKISYNFTEYVTLSNKDKAIAHNLIVGGICGAIIGIFFVLIANSVKRRIGKVI